MDIFLKYTRNKTQNDYSKVSKFWEKQKTYTINKVHSVFPKNEDISNLRTWKGRQGMGNNCTADWFNKSLTRIIKAKIPIEFSDKIKESNYGNPYKGTSKYGNCSGMFLLNMINAYEIYNYINKYTKDTTKLDICEIGTGWGQMCEILNQLYNLNSYTSIDLEETLVLAYLNACHNYNINDITLIDDENFYSKYNFCIPEKINHLKTKTYDIFINCFSFQEMSKKNVESYISFIKTTLKPGGIIISINSCGYYEINKFSDFGFHNFEILEMKPALRVTPNVCCPISSCMKHNNNYKDTSDLETLNKKAEAIVRTI